MRLSSFLVGIGMLIAAGACSGSGSNTGGNGFGGSSTGGSGGGLGTPGCTAAPDCSACKDCYSLCVCKTGSSMQCVGACGPGTGGSSTGGSSTGGSSTGGSSTGGSSTGGSSTGGSSTGGSSGDPYATARQKCVDRINAFRATLNLPPYARWTGSVEPCADGQAKSDSSTGTAHGAFGKCGEAAQNECPGWPSVSSITDGTGSCLQQMWNEGPGSNFQQHGHYINMSSTKYSKVACGFYKTSSGSIWAVQDFR